MVKLPVLLRSYVLFCKFRSEAIDSGGLNLSDLDFIFPTTLLPLTDLVISEKPFLILPPKNPDVAKHVEYMLGDNVVTNGPRLPLRFLPEDRSKADDVIRDIADSQNSGNVCCGESAFKYLLSELVDNIYEHSEFSSALVMAQRYDKMKFVEMCFFDNGLTIPGALAKAGKKLSALQAVQAAVSGTSTKGLERGFGLGSSIKLATAPRGLNGRFLLVSGTAALSVEPDKAEKFDLSGPLGLGGTLVSIRIPFSSKDVNIYDYVS